MRPIQLLAISASPRKNSWLANYSPLAGKGFSTSDKPPFLALDAEALIEKLTEQIQESTGEPSELERLET